MQSSETIRVLFRASRLCVHRCSSLINVDNHLNFLPPFASALSGQIWDFVWRDSTLHPLPTLI